MTASKIEWTDRSDWNPIRGCTRVSPGCGGPGPHGGCYAEAIAARFSAPGQPFHGFAERTSKGPRWTGKVAVQWDRLDLPLRWRTPARIFASSTSDFFNPGFKPSDIAQLFAVMIAAHHLRGHTFQVLTKRAETMRALLTCPDFWELANAEAEMHVMRRVDPLARRSDDARATLDDNGPANPPPGIWLGVSVEDQARADERIPDLLATPAAVRFISAEPLLGPVDLTNVNGKVPEYGTAKAHGTDVVTPHNLILRPQLDWVIAGGESGPGARPMHPDWARSLRDQCATAGVAFHFKQWGEWAPGEAFGVGSDGPVTTKRGDVRDWMNRYVVCEDRADRLRGHSFTPHATDLVYRVGKKHAGRLLDGVTHDGFPA